MTLSIPNDLAQRIQQRLQAGCYNNETEVLSAALDLLERRDRLHEEIAVSLAQFEAGQYTAFGPDSLAQFRDVIAAEEQRLPGKTASP
jgi:Arc/MetJ-type ribon-helix-helix transcriptional regulator